MDREAASVLYRYWSQADRQQSTELTRRKRLQYAAFASPEALESEVPVSVQPLRQGDKSNDMQGLSVQRVPTADDFV